MSSDLRIGVIGDFNPALESHRATNEALRHSAQGLSLGVEVRWLPTESFIDTGCEKVTEGMDGLWASPGSPYNCAEGALEAIRFAREHDRPFIGT